MGEECKAVRERVGILDLGGFTKLLIEGDGAAAWLDKLICGKLPKQGRVTLSYALNDKGGIISEFTVTRLAENRFYLISAAVAEWHDLDWLEKHRPKNGALRIENHTTRYGSIIIAGPKARDVLSQVTDADLSNAAFPWLSAREIEIGYARLLALARELCRRTGLGTACAGGAYGGDLRRSSGRRARNTASAISACTPWIPCGWRNAIAAGRATSTHEYTPFMASLDRFVDLTKSEFMGKAALLKEHNSGPRERFVPLLLEDAGTADALYCSSVWQGQEIVGLVGSGGYGHRIGKSIALAYVRTDLAKPGMALDVEIFGERRRAVVAQEPLYDPTNAQVADVAARHSY